MYRHRCAELYKVLLYSFCRELFEEQFGETKKLTQTKTESRNQSNPKSYCRASLSESF